MRVAVVGLGDAGAAMHLPALAGLRDVAVVGAADPDAGRREHAAAAFRVPVFDGVDRMLSESRPDMVIVATPPDTHAACALQALAAGAHVLCEKPFVASLDEADRVLAAAAEAGRGVAVNHQFREMPIFRALCDEAGRIGRDQLRFAQVWQLMDLAPWAESGWRGRMAERTLYEAGVHLVDFLMALFGERPVAVQATASAGPHDGGARDAVMLVTLEFSRGRLAQITQNRLCKGPMQYFEVRADTPAASLRASFGGRLRVSAGLYRSTRPHVRIEYGLSGLAWMETGTRRTVLARNPKEPMVAATRAVLTRTVEAFRTGAEPPTSGRRARDTIDVIARCYEAARTGERIRLDMTPPHGVASPRLGDAPGA